MYVWTHIAEEQQEKYDEIIKFNSLKEKSNRKLNICPRQTFQLVSNNLMTLIAAVQTIKQK